MTRLIRFFRPVSLFALLTCLSLTLPALSDPVPTTIDDFFLPGSQDGQSGSFQSPDNCDNCHGGYNPAVEPAFGWRGSMMSQAARDPLYFATVSIANQDAPESGDLCIRCHAPAGWLQGRSIPTNGSALTAADRESVYCIFCHRMVKPSPLGTNPYPDDSIYTADTYAADQVYLATLDEIPAHSANGMFIIDSQNVKRGPYSDAEATHQMYYSPFHNDANNCGTCHDVSNPAFTGSPETGYAPNEFGQPAPDFSPYAMFPVERTFSEWKMSEYNTPGGVYAPQFGGNQDYVSTCMDCHMRDATGKGCNKSWAITRDDLGLHDLTGGNTFVPNLIESAFPGESHPDALAAGVDRALYMLRNAVTMDLSAELAGSDYDLEVTITNETGHKLPSGYPEGRRVWINVQVYDNTGALIYESGEYDEATGTLIDDPDIKIYQVKPGISPGLASVVNLPAGPSFHFVLNDTVYSDNRIPPRGFTNANFAAIQSPPVGYSYEDGDYWDETDYTIPGNSGEVIVTLYYQTTSKEYVEFLRDENTTDDWGNIMYDLWLTNGMSAPVAMVSDTLILSSPPPPPDIEITLTPAGSTTIPAGGGNLVFDVYLEHVGSDPLDFDAWIDIAFEGGTPTTVIQRGFTNFQPGWSINRPGMFFPIPGSYAAGNYTFTGRVGLYPDEIWDESGFPFIKEGNAETSTFQPFIPEDIPDIFAAGMVEARQLPGRQIVCHINPNPFNPSTTISYQLPAESQVLLTIYDITGRRLVNLVDERQAANDYRIDFDGSAYTSGIYFYRLTAGIFNSTGKLVLMK